MSTAATPVTLREATERIRDAEHAVDASRRKLAAAQEKATELAHGERASIKGPTRDRIADMRAASAADTKAGFPDAVDAVAEAERALAAARRERAEAARAELKAARARFEREHQAAVAEAVAAVAALDDALDRIADVERNFRASSAAAQHVVGGVPERLGTRLDDAVRLRLRNWARRAA